MLHNGSIVIEKTGYDGTVFLIELPLSDEAELDSDTKAIMLNRFSTSVLLLDDDQKIREVLRIFLKEFKYSVLEAADGAEALQTIRNNVAICKVVIMDWKLGNENPHHIIRNIRNVNPDLIVIVVSGYPPDEKSIAAMHIARWLTKPYDRNLLDLEIQRALHKKSAPRPEQNQAADEKDVSHSPDDEAAASSILPT
jgi:DNA-binding NtrC family response regulator